MIEGPIIIFVMIGVIIFIIISTSVLKLHPFLSLLFANLGVGLTVRMPLNNFVLPGNEKWYSFTQGNALFICLLSEEDFAIQYNWLLAQLKSTDKEWIIVYFHRPFFIRGSHKDEMKEYRTTWWKAFDDYGVDLVMSGHTHSYIRTYPLNLNISSVMVIKEYGSTNDQGRLEFVSGGLGEDNSSASDKWFTAKAYSGMHHPNLPVSISIKSQPVSSSRLRSAC